MWRGNREDEGRPGNASRIFALASASVSPVEAQPGISGQTAEKSPVSGSAVTGVYREE
jgi:hypothetical protein